MLGIDNPCERHRQCDDARDGRRDSQATDEQNSFRSTMHLPDSNLHEAIQVLITSLVALVT